MNKIIVCLLFLTGSLLANGQNPLVLKYGNMITQKDLKGYLSIIASDSMEGRETGTRGQKMAADYIRSHFKSLGLKGPVEGKYYQPFDLYRTGPGETYIKKGSREYVNFDQIVYTGRDNSNGEITLPLVYVGLGREDDFNAVVDVKDKAVLIWVTDGRLYNLEEADRARDRGAKAVLIWNTDSPHDFAALSRQTSNYFTSKRPSLEKPTIQTSGPGLFVLSPRVVEEIVGASTEQLKQIAQNTNGGKALKKLRPVTIQYKNSIEVKTISSENVLGYLEGSDKKNELIVITAHYDHIGIKEGETGDRINNGADDDGSGTVTVMELAKVFSQAKKEGHGPRRSILFMTVSGEEKGLLGSDHYTRFPVFPLENTVVDLNIDMVGRRDPQHKDSAAYVYVIGSDKLSSTLHEINEEANNTYTKLAFDYTYNDESHPTRLYYRSDHWNFAKNNIPIIFYFDGIHEDYHKPSDEIEKIEFDLLALRAKCVFYTAWEIANRNERIVPDVEKKK